jgi:SAM-dependent methyltransferase
MTRMTGGLPSGIERIQNEDPISGERQHHGTGPDGAAHALTRMTSNAGWGAWLKRWDAQQEGYLPDRETRFSVITEAVAGLCDEPLVLDLGCGPGSLSARILAGVPGSRVVAVDADPVLLSLGRHALSDFGGRLHWVDADLRGESWPSELPVRPPFDAAVSTTALHWLHTAELAGLYQRLGGLLRKGGLFIDGDHIAYEDDQSTIETIAGKVAASPEADPARETWREWWAAVERDPPLAEALAERGRRRLDHAADEDAPPYSVHRRLLTEAGFAEVGTLWQRGGDRILIAVR